jgi:hypothetical protein
MKVFVAFGYNERDKWIPEMVFPILEAFGIEVKTGEKMLGEIISEEVRERIKNSDALIGFLTRRGGDLGNGTYNTHQWVRDEIALAFGAKRKAILVVEDGVDISGGAFHDRQYLTYNEAQRDKFLVELVMAVSLWAGATSTLRIRLLPGDFCDEIKPLIRRGENIECQYHYLIGSHETEWEKGNLLSLPAGVVLDVNTSNLPPRREDVYIEVKANHPASGKRWKSDYDQLALLSVTLLNITAQ